jgi:hypothetical protein
MTYVATVDLFVGVFAHLLLEQLVCRVPSHHGRHDEYVGVGVGVLMEMIITDAKIPAKDDRWLK